MRLWCQVPTTVKEESFVAPTELGRRFKGIWRDGVNSRENKIPAVGQPRSGRVVGFGQDKERNGTESLLPFLAFLASHSMYLLLFLPLVSERFQVLVHHIYR